MSVIKCLSPEHIQSTGRDFWQSHFDNDDLDSLPESVAEVILEELWEELFPNDNYVPAQHGLPELVEAYVDEYLDVAELNQEAEDNTQYLREIEEARRGQY